MKEFEDSFKNVYGSIPVDAEKVGTAIGEVNTQLDLTGKAFRRCYCASH